MSRNGKGLIACCTATAEHAPVSGGDAIRGVRKEFATIDSEVNWRDRLGMVHMRIGIGRYRYAVEPGLYAVGRADGASPVLVTSNYKMTFDLVRRALKGRNAWLLVLNTKGINVWCAAGKGTFGTDELVHRIEEARLGELVEHKQVILPQLGAPGVAAHEVQRRTGFRVAYGPVFIKDIGEFLDNGLRASAQMRRVRSTLVSRLLLTPMELIGAWQVYLVVAAVIALAALVRGAFHAGAVGPLVALQGAGAVAGLLAGAVVTPALLPWIPGRAFAWKGWLAGLVMVGGVLAAWPVAVRPVAAVETAAALCTWSSLAALLAMLFTGASTFTSLSGVRQEVRLALPAEAALALVGIVLMCL